MKRQAEFDYTLSGLIGVSISKIFDSKTTFPNIEDVYTGLFEKREEEEDATTASINNFMSFAMAHNKRQKELSKSE